MSGDEGDLSPGGLGPGGLAPVTTPKRRPVPRRGQVQIGGKKKLPAPLAASPYKIHPKPRSTAKLSSSSASKKVQSRDSDYGTGLNTSMRESSGGPRSRPKPGIPDEARRTPVRRQQMTPIDQANSSAYGAPGGSSRAATSMGFHSGNGGRSTSGRSSSFGPNRGSTGRNTSMAGGRPSSGRLSSRAGSRAAHGHSGAFISAQKAKEEARSASRVSLMAEQEKTAQWVTCEAVDEANDISRMLELTKTYAVILPKTSSSATRSANNNKTRQLRVQVLEDGVAVKDVSQDRFEAELRRLRGLLERWASDKRISEASAASASKAVARKRHSSETTRDVVRTEVQAVLLETMKLCATLEDQIKCLREKSEKSVY